LAHRHLDIACTASPDFRDEKKTASMSGKGGRGKTLTLLALADT
jgi:hypothetical protein